MALEVIRLDLPASNKYLNVLCNCLGAMLDRIEHIADREATTNNIQLAVNEVFANIVGHAYAGIVDGRITITVMLYPYPRRMCIELNDTGAAFDPSTVVTPNLEEVQVHGYGLFLIHELMDEVNYQAGSQGNHWRLAKHL